MAKFDCEICCGAGQIRLPRHQRTLATQFDASVATIEPTYKVYPCPECELTTPIERIAIVDFHSRIAHRDLPSDKKFVEVEYRNIAFRIADRLLRDNFFRFVTSPADPTANYAATITGTLGAVAPTHVATIEQRQREHQEKIANEIATESIAQIDNWGSHYGHSEILKRDARQMIHDALKTVLNRYKRGQK